VEEEEEGRYRQCVASAMEATVREKLAMKGT